MNRCLLVRNVQNSLRVRLHLIQHKLELFHLNYWEARTPVKKSGRVHWPDQALSEVREESLRLDITVQDWNFFKQISEFVFLVALNAVRYEALNDFIVAKVARNINREKTLVRWGERVDVSLN